MSAENLILTYRENGFSWIRCEGKGTFLSSPPLKKWADGEIDRGVSRVVVDLSHCSGMDSTFMGTLAGLAMRLMKVPDGQLLIAEPGDKNQRSLESLGLGSLMKINPSDAFWNGRITEIREKLKPQQDLAVAKAAGASYVLDAHKKLCEADEKNTEKFGTVLDFLEAEVKAKQNGKG